jgi:hypothetical protein
MPKALVRRQVVQPNKPKRQPLVYWRVVGVTLGTTALVIITLIFALKALADSRRSATPAPARNQIMLPAPLEQQGEDAEKPKPDTKPRPRMMEPAPMKDEEKKEAVLDAHAKSRPLLAAVENHAPSGFN